MMKKYWLLLLLICFLFNVNSFSQTATFITLDNNGNLYRVTVGSSGCTSTPLNLCNNITGNPRSIALDGNKLYIVDDKGNLYKNTLTNSGTMGNCTKLGTFPTTTSYIDGMTVGNGGIVYGAVGSKIETYNPATNTFATLGSMPSQWTIGGDLLFYKGVLYEAVKINNVSTNCALIEINLTNVANSTLYMNFNAGTNAFGFASVTVPCSNNQAYALSNGISNTKIYAIDMAAKTEATTATCTLNYNVFDAASIAETQSATPPPTPTITSPVVNYCQFQTTTPLNVAVSAPDTLRWYTQAINGTSYGSPTPALSTTTAPLTTKYYVSNFDTSTGCESPRDSIIVNVYPYPAVPTINPTGTNTICAGNTLTLTSSSATGNQWLLNGSSLGSAAINQTYAATAAGDYTVTVTGTGGCSKTSVATTLNVTNANISYTGSPFCNTGTATVNLTGNTGGTFSATPTGLSIDATTGTINLAASAVNTYTITYTVGVANCTFTTSIQIVHPTATISYAAAQFCKASGVQNVLLASGSTSGGNYSVTPSGLTINTTTGAITPASSTLGNYTISYTYGTAGVGCGLQTTATNVAIVDTTKSLTNKNICQGDSLLFNGIYYKTAGLYTFNTINASGCDSVATLILNINVKTTSTANKTICKGDSLLFNGTYYKTAGSFTYNTINAAGCDSTATLNLAVEDFKLTLTATPNPVIAAANVSAQITATTAIASSVWQPSNLFVNNISTQTIIAPNSSFLLKVSATSINGCIDSAQSFITVNIVTETIYIPNAFSPTSTNTENKTLKVYGSSIKTVAMDIFNEWGNKIATMNDASNIGWDGTADGKIQNAAVYAYTAKIILANGKTIVKKGLVNLIR